MFYCFVCKSHDILMETLSGIAVGEPEEERVE